MPYDRICSSFSRQLSSKMNLNALAEKKDEMSQDHSDILINRILTHCRQVARNMQPPRFGWSRQGAEWVKVERVGAYVSEYRSFLALTQPFQGQKLSFAFPPVTEGQLQVTEQQLGFSLPPLLR